MSRREDPIGRPEGGAAVAAKAVLIIEHNRHHHRPLIVVGVVAVDDAHLAAVSGPRIQSRGVAEDVGKIIEKEFLQLFVSTNNSTTKSKLHKNSAHPQPDHHSNALLHHFLLFISFFIIIITSRTPSPLKLHKKSPTTSASPALFPPVHCNSLCIKHRCRCQLGYRLNLDGHCVLHHCLENSHDCDRYFPNTICVEPSHRCVCESDYYLDQPTQKCLFNGPAAEQRRFWSMVITGAMMSTVFVFCCLVCKAKAVGGDNNDRVDNGENGQVRRRGVIRGGERGSHVPPPPPSSSSSSLIFPPLQDSPPDYFGIKNFPSLPQPPPPPPPPPYTP
ncbi:hypothetical protein TYRP_019757 [Tyrophagus putrescentiae]|nr:hypothetical protein TYRP_019757 [Tyrophagus putrescentiae]